MLETKFVGDKFKMMVTILAILVKNTSNILGTNI